VVKPTGFFHRIIDFMLVFIHNIKKISIKPVLPAKCKYEDFEDGLVFLIGFNDYSLGLIA